MYAIQMRYKQTRGMPVDTWDTLGDLYETEQTARDDMASLIATGDKNPPSYLREEWRVVEV